MLTEAMIKSPFLRKEIDFVEMHVKSRKDLVTYGSHFNKPVIEIEHLVKSGRLSVELLIGAAKLLRTDF